MAITQPVGISSANTTGPSQLGQERRTGIALCLSGGGFRASIFHVGALRRLNELGVLSQVDTFSCVSGGSIIGGYLAYRIGRGLHAEDARYIGLDAVLDEFLQFTRRDIRTLPTLARLRFWEKPGRAPRAIEGYYRKLVGEMRLVDLPSHPRFIFCGTNLFFANSWVCERDRLGDYQSGYVRPPPDDWSLARAIAVSSCFPPVFDPVPVDIASERYSGGASSGHGESSTAADSEKLAVARSQLTLTDGGVYDNLGLEPVWKRHATILVSDGGKPLQHKLVAPGFRLMRYSDVIQNQVLALRKRWLVDTFIRSRKGIDEDTFNGAYWGIGSAVSSYGVSDYGYSKGLAVKVANIRTDLNGFSPNEIAILEKHGYELADAAVRTHAPHLVSITKPKVPTWSARLLDEERVQRALRWSGSRFLSTFTGGCRDLIGQR